jgi:16S rRNA (guanine527-N7)-methyltransferase
VKEHEKEILRSWAHDHDIDLSEERIHLLDLFLMELWEWNRKINLTGLSSTEKVIKELLLDSLLPSPFLPKKGLLLDMGSGAGFPAIPLKICNPGLEFHLVEANFKKSVFLKQVIRRTGLEGISVIRGRVEDRATVPQDGYRVVTSRAMSGWERMMTLASPYLASGGILVAFLGKAHRLEDPALLEGEGFRLHRSIPYRLPGKEDLRTLVLLEKR